jgi:hypothetical protein
MDAEALARLIDRATPAEVAAAFSGMDEAARCALRPTILALRKSLRQGERPGSGGLAAVARWALGRPSEAAAHFNSALVVLACGTLSEVRRIDLFGHRQGQREALVRVLADRRPGWIQAWVEHCLDTRDWPSLTWETVRALMAAGLCQPPRSVAYVHMMTTALNHWPFRQPAAYVPLHRQILDQPDLIPTLWRLFEVETPAFALDWARRRADLPTDYEDWPTALARLAGLGVLERDRLLDETLAAIWRVDKGAFQSAQLALHQALAPTAAERLARADAYLDLVRHRNGPVVSFGLRQVGWLLEQGALEWPRVARATPSVFTLRSKAQGLTAVRLLGRGTRLGALGAADLVEPVRAALAQGQSEVQAAALDLVAAVPDPGGFLAALVAEYREDLPALLRGAGASPASDAGEDETGDAADVGPDVEIVAGLAALPGWVRQGLGLPDDDTALAALTDGLPPPLAFRTWEVPQLAARVPLTPVASVDELIDLAAHLVETVPGAAEVETLIDGIGRLGARRPAGFADRAAPLLKRLESVGGSVLAHGLVGDGAPPGFHDLLLAWLLGHPPGGALPPWSRLVGPVRLLQQRLVELAARVAAGEQGPVLAAPTHAGGWIDPGVLVERLAETLGLGLTPLATDCALALLRLAPEGRVPALEAAAGLPGDPARALRFVLGSKEDPTRADRGAAPLWVAAARARDPAGDLTETLAPLGLRVDWPDLARPAIWSWEAGTREVRLRQEDRRVPALNLTTVPPYTASTGESPGSGTRGLIGVAAALGRAGRALFRQVSNAVESGQAAGPAAFPTVLVHERTDRVWRTLGLAAPWQIESLTWLWPARPEPLLAWGAECLMARLDQPGASTEPGQPFLLPLLDPDLAWSDPGHLALWLGLLSRDRESRALALDGLIAAIEDGRADPHELAETLTRLRAGGWVKPNRIAAALAEGARPAPLHALIVSRLIEVHLADRGIGTEDHPILAVLTELLATLERPVAPELRETLGGLTGRGKAAVLARGILGRGGERHSSASQAAVRDAWVARLQRGERWAGGV